MTRTEIQLQQDAQFHRIVAARDAAQKSAMRYIDQRDEAQSHVRSLETDVRILTNENVRLREALRPFANLDWEAAPVTCLHHPSAQSPYGACTCLACCSVASARAALAGGEK